jgi:hypothetical protein
MESSAVLDTLIANSAESIVSIAPTLPSFESIQAVMKNVEVASARGYFLPDEDETIRTLFANYLTTRSALLQMMQDLRPYAVDELSNPKHTKPELFIVSYCAACLVMRTGRFLVDSFRKNRLVWRKLDEAEPRFGIPPKQFTRVYHSLSSLRNVWIFLEANRYWREQKTELLKLQSNPAIKPVLDLLLAEEPWVETSKRYYTSHHFKYRLHSFLRRHHSGFKNVTFALFKLSGNLISQIHLHGKRKRVTPGVQRKLARLLQPGDVLITRHDDAASNLFLPGFWPHGALYIGTEEQRQQLAIVSGHPTEETADPACVLEALKDGLRFRPLSQTLNVDSVTLLRPRLEPSEIRECLMRAMTHAGKPYDFEFDFRRTDKLVCTEVIYRAYHGCGKLRFELIPRMGRVCLSAEDLLNTAIDQNFFEIIAIYGVAGNRFLEGKQAKEMLIASYRKA